ncbi:MAG: haloacid dehalogenase-like hydrolase [Anaerococcus sp.]|nr:haloacid dehalogenase-like hydrolase [Anaerococcus sp.]
MKRFLDAFASDIMAMDKDDLIESIRISEGRVILSENNVTITQFQPMITNSEIARAFGADLILLNCFDVFDEKIMAIDDKIDDPVRYLKNLVKRPIGLNLEPIDYKAKMDEDRDLIARGRICSKESVKKAKDLGFDIISLTGNPSTGVSNESIKEAIKLTRENFDGVIIAGKMHGSGISEKIIDEKTVSDFVDAGADVILLPAVGTFPGLTVDYNKNLVDIIHEKKALAMSAIGTSQEAASVETIRHLALLNKMTGVDIHHIGDHGYSGLAPYRNILELSIALRGESLTLRMIGSSILR